jgi:hypothetical protein
MFREIWDEGKIPLNDFIEYWSASHAFIEGRNLYDPEVLLEIQRVAGWKDPYPLMMWNPPWTLPLLLPFSLLSYGTARGLWCLLSLMVVFTIADWFWRRCGGNGSHRWLSWLAVLLFIPVGTALFRGQISPLLLAGLWGFLWALEKKWLGTAGAFLLLIAVKPHVLYVFWIFLFLWILRERVWPVLWGGLAAFAFSSLFAVLFNPSIFGEFWRSIRSSSGPMIWQTPTWGIALRMLFPWLSKWVRFLPSFIGLGAAWYLWRVWRQNFDWKRHLPTIILLSITTNSFTWTFDWIVLLPIVIIILIWFEANPGRGWWLLAGLTSIIIALIIQPFIVTNYFYNIWLPPALWLLYFAGTLSGAPAGCGVDTSALASWREKLL